ncbi:MAG: glycosyltransferase family 2 protein [Candidatus Aminicenantes bacterium]|nr:glycosyltransferase family 2 protein [Candidatus Aminicenantes bacterium]
MDAPRISIIMPCYNEERNIYGSIKSLISENFNDNCELIVVDGKSSDWTKRIVQDFIDQGLNIRIIDNEKKIQAHGLNLGISEAKGTYIVRADAHCVYSPEYVEKCVNLLEETEAANVGGIMLPQGKSTVQKAIAFALQHPIGVGDAKWHTGNYKGYVDTVYLGTFQKSLFEKIGFYDTNCKTAEDAELNLRILKAGKKIYLDSSIKVTYFPRETLMALAKQYFRYGKGRCYTILKHKKFTSSRQYLPVFLVIGLLVSIGLSFWYPIILLFPFVYIFSLLLAALFSWPKKGIPIKLQILMGISWGIMHVMWGMGFLSYFLFGKRSPRKARDDR